jgi:hypothetical protein
VAFLGVLAPAEPRDQQNATALTGMVVGPFDAHEPQWDATSAPARDKHCLRQRQQRCALVFRTVGVAAQGLKKELGRRLIA